MVKLVSLLLTISAFLNAGIFLCLIKMKKLFCSLLFIISVYAFLPVKKQQNIINVINAITRLVREINFLLDSGDLSNDEDT